MGNEESKSWLFQNVLFLDPNAPPFISQEEYERRQRARETGEDVYGAVNGNRGAHGENDKRGVKRFTPGQTKLRTRAFRVLVDVGGRSSEFQLKCSNDPMAFILMDRQSRPLRTIPTGEGEKSATYVGGWLQRGARLEVPPLSKFLAHW